MEYLVLDLIDHLYFPYFKINRFLAFEDLDILGVLEKVVILLGLEDAFELFLDGGDSLHFIERAQIGLLRLAQRRRD
jgi:hypothetical protein